MSNYISGPRRARLASHSLLESATSVALAALVIARDSYIRAFFRAIPGSSNVLPCANMLIVLSTSTCDVCYDEYDDTKAPHSGQPQSPSVPFTLIWNLDISCGHDFCLPYVYRNAH